MQPEVSMPLRKGGTSIAFLMVAFLTATFAFQLNASMLSPALVTMQNELNTTATQIGLSQTVFFTSAALFSLFLPRLADLMGRKKVLMGMLLFTVAGCTVSTLAPNVTVLLVGRLLQGAAGPIVTLCIIMLHVRVPDEKQYTKLMAVITSVNGGISEREDGLAGCDLPGCRCWNGADCSQFHATYRGSQLDVRWYFASDCLGCICDILGR